MSDKPLTDEQYRKEARDIAFCGATFDIEIDEDAHVSRAHDHPPDDSGRCHKADEDGAYVQAWLWVPVDDVAADNEPCPCDRPGPVLHRVGEKCCQ